MSSNPSPQAPAGEGPRSEPPARGTAGVAPIVEQLRRVRGRARSLLVAGALATILAALVAAVLGVGVIDYLVRLPGWLRGVVWVGGVAALGYGLWKLLRPAALFSPSLTEVALRLEKSETGKKAGLGGVLASGLELAEHPEPSPVGGWMSQRVVEDAARRFGDVAAGHAGSLLTLRRVRDSFLAAGLCVAAAVLVMAMAGPSLSRIALARVAAPWAGVQWPKRTLLADVTGIEVHPLGTTLPLRAAVVKTDRARGETKVVARYRVITGEASGVVHRAVLTGQSQDVEVDPQAGQRGELYERLVEPGALAGAGREDGVVLEYWFESQDDRTAVRKVRLVRPPAVVAARAAIQLPEYARGLSTSFVSGSQDLGGGVDQRAVVGPVLAGSEVELTVRLNKAVPPPPEEGEARAEWLRASLGELPREARASFDANQWRLSWRAAESLRLPLRPGDEYGIRGADDATFSFDVVEDRAPSATVVEPREDEAVLATAKVNVTGEGRDDVGVSEVELLYQAAKPAKGSIGAAPEAIGEMARLSRRVYGGAEQDGPVTMQASAAGVVDLGSLKNLDLKPGDELWIFAAVRDNFELDEARHEVVRSSPRKLRIIREEDLIEQVRSELASVRKVAMRLDEEQAELKKKVESGLVSAEESRRQGTLGQRITQQSETIQRLQDRVQRNQLNDDGLEGLLRDIKTLLDEASQEGQRAGSQMEAALEGEEQAELNQQQQEEIAKAQEQVREKLGQVAETLDRGEDNWVISRTLQRLAEQQRELQARTQRAGERTMGKRPEDLTPQERSELQEIAEQQQRLSDAAQRAIEQLEERAKQMEKVDATEAEGMRRAAERGKQNDVPQKMQEAGRNVQQNQTSTAEGQQQEAADALDQMLQDMNEAQRNRDQALRRVLATLLQSLEKLIQEQEGQLNALAAVMEEKKFEGLDAAMIALNTNTLAVAEVARSDRATIPIAEIIDKAVKQQEQAIAALRATPADGEKAEQGEKESLRLLRLAHAEAKKLDDAAKQREAERKKAQLRQAYREALEEQVAVHGAAEPMFGRNLDRRERLQVRALGERQETLRQRLEEIRKQTAEIDEAGVFKYAHERLDGATAIAGKKLRAGQADQVVDRNQRSAMRILQSLLEALDQRAQEEDEFREEESESGGGGGGGGTPPLIPPIAELKLLRSMQQEAMEMTRMLDESENATPEELHNVGQFQRNLHTQAEELVKKLQQQQPGEEPGQPGDPGKERP